MKLSNEEAVAAYCSVQYSGVMIHDLRLMRLRDRLTLAMPTRKIQARCTCGKKNVLRASFCNWCGTRLPPPKVDTDDRGRPVYYADIVHPLTPRVRQNIEEAVIRVYRQALAASSGEG